MNRSACVIWIIVSIALFNTAFLKRGKPQTSPDIFLNAESDIRQSRFFQKALTQSGNEAFSEQAKISYLVDCIRRSRLTFIRNGEFSSGGKAAAHLLWKYQRKGKGIINTARLFIDAVASHSSISGKAYQVKFPNGKIYPLRDLLLNELKRFEHYLQESRFETRKEENQNVGMQTG